MNFKTEPAHRNFYKLSFLNNLLLRGVVLLYRNKKAQSSVEYLFVVALSLLLVVPASFLFFNYSKSSEDTVVASQIERAGNEVLLKAEEVYSIGNGSWITVEFKLPRKIAPNNPATIFNNDELVFNYSTQTGYAEAVFFTDLNLTTDEDVSDGDDCASSCPLELKSGINKIQVISKGDYILIKRIG